MSIKKNLKDIKGLTLIEILIGIIITTLIMGAMFTTYSIVNQTYTQVSEKAKISRSSRDLVSMLMRVVMIIIVVLAIIIITTIIISKKFSHLMRVHISWRSSRDQNAVSVCYCR